MIRVLAPILALACLSVAVGASGGMVGGAGTVRVLYYSQGVMEKVAANHMNPNFGDGTDYVPSLRLSPCADCLLAVNWGMRSLVPQNALITVDFWGKVEGRYERHTCQAVDWQQLRHATVADRQPVITRIELDWNTAKAVNAVPANTWARIVRIDYEH